TCWLNITPNLVFQTLGIEIASREHPATNQP
ncbi:MAG: hypothetical protein ACJAXB_002421, partial [Candidatus Endobugula sp.]